MKIAIIDCGTNRIPELKEITGGFGAEYRVFDMHDVRAGNCGAEKLSQYNGIIISGGPGIIDDTNLEEYLEYFSFFKNLDIPILGICFGHQLLGHIYGCDYSITETIIGTFPIKILTPNDPIFGNIETFSFCQNHSEHITLPDNFELLAQSDDCKNEAMKNKEKNIYGVQFHPEVDSSEGIQLIENFLKMCW